MKIYRKNRIKTNNILSTNIIFLASQTNINPNKKINLNFTKIYYLDNYITECQNIKNIETEFNIHQSNIINIINIYKNKLFIVLLDFNTNIDLFKEHTFIDLYNNKTSSTYYDIYNYNCNFFNNSYLNYNIKNNNMSLKMHDLYYYLIGY